MVDKLSRKSIFFFLFLFVIINIGNAQGILYGLAQSGGLNLKGTIFQLNTTNNSFFTKVDLDGNTTGSSFYGAPIIINSKLYALTSAGGANSNGALIEYDLNSAITTIKVNFDGLNKGRNPRGSLTLFQNKLYGMTSDGGINDEGVLFEYDYINNLFVKKIDLSATVGSFPQYTTLTVFGNKLYGMTFGGGANLSGVLFSYTPSTSVMIKLLDFNTSIGLSPSGSLIVYNDKLYGLTNIGGSNNKGTLFEYDTLTSILTKKIDFDGTTNGSIPYGSLVAYNTKLYGMNNTGGTSNKGTIFEYDPSNGVLTTKIEFNGTTNGGSPRGSLIVNGTKLYGMTPSGGTNGKGIIFEYDPVGNVIVKKQDLDNTTGHSPHGDLYLYNAGMAQTISSWNNRTIIYGDVITLAAVSSSGLPITYTSSDNSKANITGNSLTAMELGTFNITASQAGNGIYAPVDSVIQLTIGKKTLDVLINNAQRNSCEPNPVFTASYSGFVFSDIASELNVLPTFTSTAGSATGKYPITGAGGSDFHYLFNYQEGTLTVLGGFTIPDIIGKNVISVGSAASYICSPLYSSYTYQWYYTGEGLELFGDSISQKYAVFANSFTTNGDVVCIVTHCGYKDTIRKSITINRTPTLVNFLADLTCEIKQSRCDSSYLISLSIENMFQTPVSQCSPSGYSDYTDSDITGTLYVGEAYTINIIGGGFPGYFGLWIDYDNNGDFGGPQEMLSANFDPGFKYIVPNIVIPNFESYKGPRRMRIRTRLNKPFTSNDYCQGEDEVGETEDYLISLDIRPALEAPNFITPNADGLNDLFVIRGVNSKTNNSLIILDRLGKLIYESDDYKNDWPALDSKELKVGVYYYIYKNGENELRSYIEVTN